MPNINLFGVLLAALSAFVVGSVWYAPFSFLPAWQKMTGTSEADLKKNFPRSMAWIAVASLLTAYVLAHFMYYTGLVTGTTGVMGGLQTAFWLWLGISATTIVASGSLESRSPMLMVIQAGNRLATLLLMGLILGFFM